MKLRVMASLSLVAVFTATLKARGLRREVAQSIAGVGHGFPPS